MTSSRAKRYEAIHIGLHLGEIVLTLLALVWFLASGLSGALARHCEAWTGNPWGQSALFGAVVIVAGQLLFLPLDWVSEYHVEHRFGLSRQPLSGWFQDRLKALGLSLALGCPLLSVGHYLLRTAGATWWLWATAVVVALSALLSALVPVLILPLFYKLHRLDNESLRRRLLHLAQQVGVRVLDLYRIELSAKTRKANAALTGWGSTKRILLGDTLLNEFAEDEIEVVMAHELAHYRHGDVSKMIACQALTALIGFAACEAALRDLLPRWGLAGRADLAAFPLLALILFGVGLLLAPAHNAFSRWRERLADRAALDWTGNPDGFLRVLRKLAAQNLADAAPHPLIEFLFHTHPSIQHRMELAQQWNRSATV